MPTLNNSRNILRRPSKTAQKEGFLANWKEQVKKAKGVSLAIEEFSKKTSKNQSEVFDKAARFLYKNRSYEYNL